MKVAFYTLGCKVNRYETQAMSEILKNEGYETVSENDDADVYVINSCTVTAEADKKTRQAVRRFKRKNPQSVVVLTGCMPQAYPEEALKLTQADIVLGNKNNAFLPRAIEAFQKNGVRIFGTEQHKQATHTITRISLHLTDEQEPILKFRTAVTASAPIALSPPQGAECAQSRFVRLKKKSL